MSARGFVGAGNLYISRYTNGAWAEFAGPYECTKLEIKPNLELKEMTSKGRGTYGQVIETVAIPKAFELTVELAEVNKESLAIALLGTTAALSQTAGSLVDEAVTVTTRDVWLPLSKANWSAAPVVKNTAGSTTYVNGVDYIYNARLGWIKVLASGSIAAAASIKVSVAYAAISGTQVLGATSSNVRAKFKLEGENMVDNLPCIATIHEVVIAPDSAFDFLNSDFNTVKMPGKMKTPSGFTTPFTVDMWDSAASV